MCLGFPTLFPAFQVAEACERPRAPHSQFYDAVFNAGAPSPFCVQLHFEEVCCHRRCRGVAKALWRM